MLESAAAQCTVTSQQEGCVFPGLTQLEFSPCHMPCLHFMDKSLQTPEHHTYILFFLKLLPQR